MTKIRFNGMVRGLSGRVGDLIFRQMPDGSTVVSHAPRKSKTKFSEKQLAQQERFTQASAYAHQAAKDQPLYAELAENMRAQTAYSLALSDWFKPPVIHRVEQVENRIVVKASDNVLVTRVQVTVLDDQGQVLERGDAVRSGRDWWEFASHAQGNKILAEAWDLADNVAKFAVE